MTGATPASPPAGPAPQARSRRLRLVVALVLLVGATCGLVGWSLSAGDDDGRPAAAAPTTTLETPVPTSPATTAPPVAQPAVLPVPEPSPTDPRAETPEVVLGTLALPTIGMTQPLGEGVTLTAIDRGPSHWPGTAMPGQLGNVVVAGHRVTHSRPFHDLDRLAVGDPLVFTLSDGTVSTYVLTHTEIVGPDAMHIVDQTAEHRATLFACHPKGSAAQRIVAHFRLA